MNTQSYRDADALRIIKAMMFTCVSYYGLYEKMVEVTMGKDDAARLISNLELLSTHFTAASELALGLSKELHDIFGDDTANGIRIHGTWGDFYVVAAPSSDRLKLKPILEVESNIKEYYRCKEFTHFGQQLLDPAGNVGPDRFQQEYVLSDVIEYENGNGKVDHLVLLALLNHSARIIITMAEYLTLGGPYEQAMELLWKSTIILDEEEAAIYRSAVKLEEDELQSTTANMISSSFRAGKNDQYFVLCKGEKIEVKKVKSERTSNGGETLVEHGFIRQKWTRDRALAFRAVWTSKRYPNTIYMVPKSMDMGQILRVRLSTMSFLYSNRCFMKDKGVPIAIFRQPCQFSEEYLWFHLAR
ncbi:hypothetical protein DM02DRAFT_636952 [Periconia macrospinosa]|uniref:Uncharacterized protein n=1 Tax=Periconia macrospinosa TaxID=97972 RepID=A0A2V1CX55_9PLEO|nr:hypothetical protein DM02DRAFT_636952 [Periconia macrospinosa]